MSIPPANNQLAKQVLEELISQGVVEFCLCPGGRNAPLVYPLASSRQVRLYSWPEERSAAFFALGRIKAAGAPVAVVTTSGTAAAELLPAAMEAYYTGLPLLLLTADRPRRFRGTGAPQSAEQVGLLGCYVEEVQDVAEGESCSLERWTRRRPLHLNLCFEEPRDADCQAIHLDSIPISVREPDPLPFTPDEGYAAFLKSVRYPLAVVGALPPSEHEAATEFLRHLRLPVYLEGLSGIRESPQLSRLRVTCIERLWELSSACGYPIDGILRIGGIPTARLWRDLEYKVGKVSVYSVSEQPFSGLSGAGVTHASLADFFHWARGVEGGQGYDHASWHEADGAARRRVERLFREEPRAEPSLVHALSEIIPEGARIYLGNSSPIRQWDQAAVYKPKGFQMAGSRGLNGIDGQLSTFLGYSAEGQDNWAILGDLTLLYDLAAPWITGQLSDRSLNVVLINNGGAGLFRRMFAHPAFYSNHALDFEPLANFWKWRYERWESIPDRLSSVRGGRLIELVPDAEATKRFLLRLSNSA